MALVIVGTAILAWLYGSPLRFRTYMEDGLSASLSFLNWRLVENGTDYFANDGSQTPYQRFWLAGHRAVLPRRPDRPVRDGLDQPRKGLPQQPCPGLRSFLMAVIAGIVSMPG
ncbi:hypothetical protein ACRAWF_24705 [Streptomyces sp. L7]